jgi:hypothetical protein
MQASGVPRFHNSPTVHFHNPVKSSGNSILFRSMVSVIACALFFGANFKASSEDANSTTNSVAIKVRPAHRQLSGAELYSIHCNRCHPERYPTERTAAQWKTILMHMRVRANLPAEQARTILKYLQENSGR